MNTKWSTLYQSLDAEWTKLTFNLKLGWGGGGKQVYVRFSYYKSSIVF
jgi:hypothetical protein